MIHRLHLLAPCVVCVLTLRCRGARTGEPHDQPTLPTSSGE